MNININDIANIPLKIDENYKTEVESIVRDSIAIAKEDWDAYENSWDFVKHPLIKNVPTIKEAFQLWSSECNSRFSKLKRNEERLNEIFIDIYGLKGSVSPNVDDKDITLNMANERDDVCSLISYGVGCILGRYSLDKNGIVYAGGKWDEQKYLSNSVDKDGIIPITDDEYFDDDIVNKLSDFIKNAYGEEHLEENLNYIASVLGGDGTSRSIIRDYFISEFYQNHIKTYQKRPIYWLFDSGRKNGFKCLIYMHRYQPDTLARIRTDYVHELQARYRTAIEDIERKIMGVSSSEKVKMNKKLKKLKDQSEEIQKFEEKVHHLADQMISINLDDGVKTNYEIFKDVVVKIK